MKKFNSISKVNQLATEQMSMLVGGERIPYGTKRDRITTETTDRFGNCCSGDVAHDVWCGEVWVVKSVKWEHC